MYAASGGDEMRKKPAESQVNLVLPDVRFPGADGFTLLRDLRALSNLPVIPVTGKRIPLTRYRLA